MLGLLRFPKFHCCVQKALSLAINYFNAVHIIAPCLLKISINTWIISKVLHTPRLLFKNEFILQNTFIALQFNLHCALSQRSNVFASPVFLSGRLRCRCV